MPAYRYLRVDHNLTAVAVRFGTTLDELWNLNDSGHHHHSAHEWARSVQYRQTIQVPRPAWESDYEWDYFEPEEGLGLEQFVERRNAERAERRRQGRAVGPEITAEILWYATANETFRYEQLMREAQSRGATSQDVQNLEDNPSAITISQRHGGGLFVPMVPIARRRQTAAVPQGTARVLVTIQHWVRQLLEMKADIDHATHSLRAMEARERGVRAEFTEALSTFARMDEFLRILIEGRSGSAEPHTFAAASLSTLQGLLPLRRQLFRVQQRVADLGRRLRDRAVPPQRKQALSARLEAMARDRTFSALYRRATLEDTRAYGERVAPQVQETILAAYRQSVEAGLLWAREDIEAALAPDSNWWQTTAGYLPLATALVVPFYGNLAGPPSVAVWLAQARASHTLSRALNSVGTALNASIRDDVERIVTRYVQGRRAVVTVAEYERWVERVAFSESMFHAVLRAPTGVTGINVGATSDIRVTAVPGSVTEQMVQFEEWMSTAQRLEGELQSVRAELTREQQLLGARTSALRTQIMDTIFDSSLSVEDRRRALRRLAANDVTSSVQTGNLVAGSLLVLNLLAVIGSVISDWGSQHSFPRTVEYTMGLIGGGYSSVMAALQLVANRSEANWAATLLETHGRALGHIAAGLALLQSLSSLYNTLDTYGLSRPALLASNVMGSFSGALLWGGWAATMSGYTAGAVLSALGLSLGLGAAVIGVYIAFHDEDEPTKTFFLQFVQNFGRSNMIRQLDIRLSESPDGRSLFMLDLRDVREAAQRLVFPKGVWEERPALESIGFTYEETGNLTEERPSYHVGPLDPEASRQAFIRLVNGDFLPHG